MGPRNVLLGVLVHFIFTLPFVQSIGELPPFLVIQGESTPNPILHSDVYMDDPNQLQFTVYMDNVLYNQGKMVALCFVAYANDIVYAEQPGICPKYSRILISSSSIVGSGGQVGCEFVDDGGMKKYDVVIKYKNGKWTAKINGIEIDLHPIAKYGQNKPKPSVRAAFFSVAKPLVPECNGIVSDACKQNKDRAVIVNGQLNNPEGGAPPSGAREHPTPPEKDETTTEDAEEEDEDTVPAASARFPYEIFIVLGVILVFLIGIVLGVKLVTKKWIWQLCPCCKKKGSDDEAKRRRVIDGSDEEKRSVSGDMKGPDAGSATNNGPQSENQGQGAPESSDVKVSFAPGSKENQKNAQPPPAPPIITAESPVPSPAATPPANNAPPPAPAAAAAPAPPPPPPEAPKKKKKKKKNDKDSSSSTESGTTGTTTADTKAPKEPAPKAPNLIVVTKEGEVENDPAKAKDKVQKNYNDVRQQTAVTQDPGLAVQTGRTKTNMPLATGKPAPTAVGTARPRDKTKTQLATGLAKQETDLNDPTEAKKEEHVDGGELQVADTQREVGDDPITGRGATVLNTGRGATGRRATAEMMTGRAGTVVATGKTGTVVASQGTQAGTDIDGEHQAGGDLIPVTAAGTRPTQAATITKTRGVSGTQPGDETAEAMTGRGRTTRTKGVSNTQGGTKVTDGGYETRPTQIESKEPGSSLRTGRGKTHLTHAGLMTAATQGLTGGTGGTQGTQDATAFTGRTATRVTGATQMPSSLDEGETQLPTGGGGRTGTTQMQSNTTQGGAGTTQTRAGTRTTQAATRTRTQAGTQNTQGGTGGGTQGTQDPTMAYATGKTQTYATGATQMPSTNETGETQVPTGTQPGRSGTTQGQTGTTQIGTKTQTVGARTSGTQAGTGGLTGTTQGATATTQGGAGTATTQKRTTRPTAE